MEKILLQNSYRNSGSYPFYSLSVSSELFVDGTHEYYIIIRQYDEHDIAVSLFDTLDAAFSAYKSMADVPDLALPQSAPATKRKPDTKYLIERNDSKTGRIDYKRYKCIDGFSTDPSICWKFSRSGATKIIKYWSNYDPVLGSDRYTYRLVPVEVN